MRNANDEIDDKSFAKEFWSSKQSSHFLVIVLLPLDLIQYKSKHYTKKGNKTTMYIIQIKIGTEKWNIELWCFVWNNKAALFRDWYWQICKSSLMFLIKVCVCVLGLYHCLAFDICWNSMNWNTCKICAPL